MNRGTSVDNDVSSARALIELSTEGLAVLDPSGRYLTINGAGRRILGCADADVIGEPSVFSTNIPGGTGPDSSTGSLWVGTSEIEFEMRRTQLGTGREGLLVRFCPTTAALRDRRKLAAFTRAAAAVACENRLDVVLDKLAAEVSETVGMATCAVILVDEVTGALDHVGKASLPIDYGRRLELCRQRGAPLATLVAITERRVVVARKWREEILGHPWWWQPVQNIILDTNWDTYVVAPLIVREKVIGALAGFVREGHDPAKEDIRFIAAMADQAAIAVSSARMFARLELQAAREERRKLARDMHDSVAQTLYSLSLRTKALELSVGSGEESDLGAQLRQIHELVCGAQVGMRTLIMHRRPAALGEDGFVSSVRKHVASIASREELALTVECDDEFYEFDGAVEEDLFMVVSEAVHNIVKHAGASKAAVRIGQSLTVPSVLNIVIIDNGHGFSERNDSHQSFGLVSMTERVNAHGGTLTVRSKPDTDPDHGTTVRIAVPCLIAESAPGAAKM
ncbi:sensor histidine kinase [Nocardia alni]|uniref:sensor histidine kinase n=1 Tax=Nocardia alni TaxID=2815723 RepID=UPI001C23F693|nr:histidine kinase [Nocardia alni]